MNATEIYNLAKSVNARKVAIEINIINREIIDSASDGKYVINIKIREYEVRKSVINYYRQLGYAVTASEDSEIILIDWKNICN